MLLRSLGVEKAEYQTSLIILRRSIARTQLSRNSKDPRLPKCPPHQIRDRKTRKMNDRIDRMAQKDRHKEEENDQN